MIVIYIALGIVLAVLILAFLPYILALAGGLFALCIGLGLLAGFAYLLGTPGILLALAVGFAWAIYSESQSVRIKKLQREIDSKARLGYETPDLDAQMKDLLAEKANYSKHSDEVSIPLKVRLFGSYEEREEIRRKHFGYKNDNQ